MAMAALGNLFGSFNQETSLETTGTPLQMDSLACSPETNMFGVCETEKASTGELSTTPSSPTESASKPLENLMPTATSNPSENIPSLDIHGLPSDKAPLMDLMQAPVPEAQPLEESASPSKPCTSMAGIASRESLHNNAQELIDELNNKRKQDSQLILDYKKTLEQHVQKTCEIVEQSLFGIYESQGGQVQDKLQELFATLDRIAKLETELVQFKQALGMLYQDMGSN